MLRWIFASTLCVLVVLFCVSCAPSVQSSEVEPESAAEPPTITELDQAYEGPVLNITVTEIRAIQSSSYGAVEGEVVVGIMLRAENISSDETVTLFSSSIDAYADDVSVSWTNDPALEPRFLDGDIAPGKRAEGYYCIAVPKGAQNIELHVEAMFGRVSVMQCIFSLSIPPVEETDP